MHYWAHVRIAVILGAAVLSLAACAPKSHVVGAVVPRAEPKATQDATMPREYLLDSPNSYSVTGDIDRTYATRIAHAFDHMYGNLIRIVKKNPGSSIDEINFRQQLTNIADDGQNRFEIKIWRKYLEIDPHMNRFQNNPGDPHAQIKSFVRLDPSCILLKVDFNRHDLLNPGIEGYDGPQEYLAFIPKPTGLHNESINPTPWIMSYRGAELDGSEPKDACS